MLNRIRQRARRSEGFTLIELLVVVIIIGILAAIAIPSFLGQRSKAQDAAAKSLVRNAESTMETFFTDQQTYVATAAQMSAIEPNFTWLIGGTTGQAASNQISIQAAASNSYLIETQSVSGTYFAIARNPGGTSFRCESTTAITAACTSNQW